MLKMGDVRDRMCTLESAGDVLVAQVFFCTKKKAGRTIPAHSFLIVSAQCRAWPEHLNNQNQYSKSILTEPERKSANRNPKSGFQSSRNYDSGADFSSGADYKS
jgi:hypothetical protein